MEGHSSLRYGTGMSSSVLDQDNASEAAKRPGESSQGLVTPEPSRRKLAIKGVSDVRVSQTPVNMDTADDDLPAAPPLPGSSTDMSSLMAAINKLAVNVAYISSKMATQEDMEALKAEILEDATATIEEKMSQVLLNFLSWGLLFCSRV